MSQERQFFVHIGLHKTGTTFLQRDVFPRWPGISFFQHNLHLRTFLALPKNQKVLISNEGLWYNKAGGQFPRVDWWASFADPRVVEQSIVSLREFLPEARLLISFRKHSDFVLSLYLQYLHEGGTATLEDFFDSTQDRGIVRMQRISFRHVIQVAEETFGRPSFIFLHEELKADPKGTLARIGEYLGCPPPKMRGAKGGSRAAGRTARRNRSVGYYQAKVLRVLNRLSRSELNPRGRLPLRTRKGQRLGLHARYVCQRGLLAWLLPDRRVTLKEEVRKAIDEYFQADWEFLNDKISQQFHD